MEKILVKTKGNASPTGKSRVFFTCHPDDFSKYFSQVCEDLFAAQDCAVYYTPNMLEPMTAEERSMFLSRAQLLVIPVTLLLLNTESRAMDTDIPFAIKNNIRILPLMMESGLDSIYSCDNKFGKIQYLEPFVKDATQIPYAEKLKNHLRNVLIDDGMAERIRGAFSAYMFLSYRKKDRHLANMLIQIIRRNEAYRDIAIWFDEFLIPGEEFDETIEKNLRKSRLFALLMTPNLIEKPNYVMSKEYPVAYKRKNKQKDLSILPVEMEKTDLDALADAYPEVPRITNCADPAGESDFQQRLLALLQEAGISSKPRTPVTDYLIGLAYTEGVDTETDRERGIALIRSAAEQGLAEAMETLAQRYADGTGVPMDWEEAEKWGKRYYEACIRERGECSDETLGAMCMLGDIQLRLGKFMESKTVYQSLHARCAERFGADAPETLSALNNLAEAHRMLGDYKKAREYLLQVCSKFPEEDRSAVNLSARNSLAMTYQMLGEYQKALEQAKAVYEKVCAEWGTEDPRTLTVQANLASAYCDMDDYQTALSLLKKTLSQRKAQMKEDHPDILTTLSDLGKLYGKSGDYQKSLELAQEVYDRRCVVLGERHPDTLTSMNNLAMAHKRLCHYRKALDLSAQEAALCSEILGPQHPQTLISQHNLASMHIDMAQYSQARELIQNTYDIRRSSFDPEHPQTLSAMHTLAETEARLGNYAKALELYWSSYSICKEHSGPEHPETLLHLEKIAQIYTETGTNYEEADKMLLDLEHRLSAVLTPCHHLVFGVMNSRAVNLVEWGKSETAWDLLKLEAARDLLKQVYDLSRTHMGSTNRLTIDALCNLGRSYTHLGNYAKARGNKAAARKEHEQAVKHSRRAYDLSCKLLGEKHPETLDKHNALAVALGELGDYKNAIPTMTRVYERRCEVLGKAHLDTLETLSNLSGMQSHRNKPENVLKKELEIHTTCCSILGEAHPISIRYLENVAAAYSRLKQKEDTITTDARVYELRLQTQGAEHPDTLKALLMRIASYRQYEQFSDAIELSQDAEKMSIKLYGADAEQTLAILEARARDYYRNGNKDASLKELEELYPRCSKALGPLHKMTVGALENLSRLRAGK